MKNVLFLLLLVTSFASASDSDIREAIKHFRANPTSDEKCGRALNAIKLSGGLTFERHGEFYDVAGYEPIFSGNGEYFFYVASDGHRPRVVRVSLLTDQVKEVPISNRQQGPHLIAVSANGARAIVATHGSTFFVFDIPSERVVATDLSLTLTGFYRPQTVAMNADGTRIAFSDPPSFRGVPQDPLEPGSIRIFEMRGEQFEALQTAETGADQILALAFEPDGKSILHIIEQRKTLSHLLRRLEPSGKIETLEKLSDESKQFTITPDYEGRPSFVSPIPYESYAHAGYGRVLVANPQKVLRVLDAGGVEIFVGEAIFNGEPRLAVGGPHAVIVMPDGRVAIKYYNAFGCHHRVYISNFKVKY